MAVTRLTPSCRKVGTTAAEGALAASSRPCRRAARVKDDAMIATLVDGAAASSSDEARLLQRQQDRKKHKNNSNVTTHRRTTGWTRWCVHSQRTAAGPEQKGCQQGMQKPRKARNRRPGIVGAKAIKTHDESDGIAKQSSECAPHTADAHDTSAPPTPSAPSHNRLASTVAPRVGRSGRPGTARPPTAPRRRLGGSTTGTAGLQAYRVESATGRTGRGVWKKRGLRGGGGERACELDNASRRARRKIKEVSGAGTRHTRGVWERRMPCTPRPTARRSGRW